MYMDHFIIIYFTTSRKLMVTFGSDEIPHVTETMRELMVNIRQRFDRRRAGVGDSKLVVLLVVIDNTFYQTHSPHIVLPTAYTLG